MEALVLSERIECQSAYAKMVFQGPNVNVSLYGLYLFSQFFPCNLKEKNVIRTYRNYVIFENIRRTNNIFSAKTWVHFHYCLNHFLYLQ